MLMKRISAFVAVACLGMAASAQAVTLSFDDIPGAHANNSGNDISYWAPNYGGLQWNGFSILNKNFNPGTGYEHGTVSGDWVGFNADADPAAFYSSNSAFNFVSAYLTSAWNSNQVAHLDGYLYGQRIHSQDVTISNAFPTLYTFNWDVDMVVLRSGNGDQVVIDNLTLITHPIPEPETYALMGLGLVGLLAARRRKAQTAK